MAARGRGGGTVGDMLRTLAVFGVVLGIVVVVRSASRQTGSEVRRVDDELRAQVAVARAAGLAVLAPEGLPTAWAPTSARFSTSDASVGGHPLLHAGFVTPGGAFAALEESDADVGPALDPVDGSGPRPAGSVDVAGMTWDVRRSAEGVTTLARRTPQGLVVGVSGGAPQTELETLVASLR